MAQVLVHSAILIALYQTLIFIISLVYGRNDVADIAWGGGFIALMIFLVVAYSPTVNAGIVYLVCGIWGARLSVYLFIRNRNKPEDFRYRSWRAAWGKHFFIRSYLQVFLLQGFFMWLISIPLQIAAITVIWQGWAALGLGLALWLIGFYWQALGDAQLSKFGKIKQPGAIIQTGLWRYSRHPNYFGEIVMWWGIGCMVFPQPLGWLALIGPLTITWLLTSVSGVPMLEKKYQNHAGYQQYKTQTPALFPNIRKMLLRKK